MDKIVPIKRWTSRQRQIVTMLESMTGSEVARELGLSRQRISWIKRCWDITLGKEKFMPLTRNGLEPWEVEDTGCPDGKYPSCLECPLEKCRYE